MAEGGTQGGLDAVGTELQARLDRLRGAWMARIPSYAQRMDDLKRLRAAILKYSEKFIAAANSDFGQRSRHETISADLLMSLHEVDYIRSHLKRWMKPERVMVDWKFLPARAEIRFQPLGVIGVMSPWNYPINLALMPLAAAIGAGSHVLLKPSEHTPAVSAVLAELVAEVFPPDRVDVVLGGPEVAAEFSTLPFDHLVFTGATSIGHHVMAAAAKHLTPVTLELGGKSPTVIGPGADVEHAAKRIVAMKFLNAGQTCIAPDYVLVTEGQREPLLAALRRAITAAYPQLAQNPDYTRIINVRQYQRLEGWLAEARDRGAKVEMIEPGGPAASPQTRLFPPTLVSDCPDDAQLMVDEIFGPILPVRVYTTFHEALEFVRARPRPLAFYLFDQDRGRIDYALERIVAGAVCINDAAMHFAQPQLPFGGVGPSGMGHYHGLHGFRAFSKAMPVFRQARFSGIWLLKPPYGALADRMLGFLFR